MKIRYRLPLGIVALAVGFALWLPLVHLFYADDPADYFAADGLAPKSRKMLNAQTRVFTEDGGWREHIRVMRASCQEWDFMARTFFVWGLANAAMRLPDERARMLAVMDEIIDDTVRLEKENGQQYFLMDYWSRAPYEQKPMRSLFVDGEIALMMALRGLAGGPEKYREPLHRRVEEIVRRMEASPMFLVESYPDECWIFDQSNAVAAIRIQGLLDGQDRSAFIEKWVEKAKKSFTDPETGMLVSSLTYYGEPMDGPEGSTLWMAIKNLTIIDLAFAREQYDLAREHLGRSVLGFGYSTEWPENWRGRPDVDSGAIIPLLDASPSASAFALMAAAAFDDLEFAREILATMNYGAFPVETEKEFHLLASNLVGESVLFYATVAGAARSEVEKLEAAK